MSSSESRLISGAAYLLDNTKFSDLKIKCEDRQISAHKIVETKSNIIDLSDDTKSIVYRMVEFLYRGDYQELDHADYQTIDKDVIDRSGAHHAVLHADMFAVADKYDIAALGDVAKGKFEKALSRTAIANGHYLEVINHVYSTTPESNRGLRNVIVEQTQIRGSRIQEDPVLNPRLKEIVSTTRQFAWDLINSQLKTLTTVIFKPVKHKLKDNGAMEALEEALNE
ncbi:MAG: hypothetical protein Q9161_008184 [Pseudevernia consocians]